MSLLDGLVAHWKMDEESGDRLDSSGNGYDLAERYPANPAGWSTGKIGKCVSFLDMNGELARNDAGLALSGASLISISFWVYVPGPIVNNNLSLLGYYASENTLYYFGIIMTGSPNFTIQFSFGIAGADEFYPEAQTVTQPSDQWLFIVGIFEPRVGVSIIVNNGTPVLNPYTLDNCPMGTLGSSGFDVGYSGHFGGKIDSLSIWNRVLTADERTKLWNNGNGLDYPFGRIARMGRQSPLMMSYR